MSRDGRGVKERLGLDNEHRTNLAEVGALLKIQIG